MIRFCYEADSGSDVWLLPNEQALANCDFTEAELVCNTTEGSDEDCCNFFVEEDAELKTYFFASRDGCTDGQRAAVVVEDFDDVGVACYSMGLTTNRIKNCDCLFETRPSTLVEPCHSQFSRACLLASPADQTCCATESCCSIYRDINEPQGQAAEAERKSLCNDQLPGRCLDGTIGSEDCCGRMCTSCGLELGCDASWASCSAPESRQNLTAQCGRNGICDFSQCPPGSYWHPDGEAFRRWIEVVLPEVVDSTTTAPVPPTRPPAGYRLPTVSVPTASEPAPVSTVTSADIPITVPTEPAPTLPQPDPVAVATPTALNGPTSNGNSSSQSSSWWWVWLVLVGIAAVPVVPVI